MKRSVFILSILLIPCFILAHAQSSPDSMLNDAYNKIQVAQKLMTSAHNQIAQDPSDNNIRSAISLYSEAGQLFEEAGNILKVLGSEYASQTDINGCEHAVASCVENIRMCQKKLGLS